MKLEIPDELIRDGIALGIERAIGAGVRAEFRAFLEDYFGLLTKEETAAFLGCSERTVEELWQKQTLPKDTALGDRLPRTWLPALKEALTTGRIRARGPVATKLRALPAQRAAMKLSVTQ